MSEPTETLRRAAALMRERAEAATGSPWSSGLTGIYGGAEEMYIAKWDADSETPVFDDRMHITSWQPAVALAVADWLEQEADDLDSDPDAPTYDEADLHPCMQRAIKAARAYLGESA